VRLLSEPDHCQDWAQLALTTWRSWLVNHSQLWSTLIHHVRVSASEKLPSKPDLPAFSRRVRCARQRNDVLTLVDAPLPLRSVESREQPWISRQRACSRIAR